MSKYTTGEVARRCGVTVRTVQYYDEKGLLPPAFTTEGGRRVYTDEDAAKFIKDKGYSRIYNSFNTGAWLTFYDVKVHIDNRIDPYLAEFSGEDHIRGKMQIADLEDMDEFANEYHPDAVLLELDPDYASYLIEDFEGSGRYTLVYDNTVTSTYDDTTLRWLVFECN